MTTVSVASPSTSGRATPASTGVTSPIHSDESFGDSSGTGSFVGSRPAEHARPSASMSP